MAKEVRATAKSAARKVAGAVSERTPALRRLSAAPPPVELTALAPQMQALPPTIYVNHFATGLNPGEVLVAMGTTRLGFPPNGSGPIAGVEWLQTIAMSATTAVVLRDALNEAIGSYSKNFGKIPVNPTFKVPALTKSKAQVV
jgi:hypothetical protein